MTEQGPEDGQRRALWSGRFSKAPAPEAEALGRSLDFDIRLAPQDVRSGAAHVRTLEKAGLLEADEAEALRSALEEVGALIADGGFQPEPADEDVHSAIERGVTDRLGPTGERLHAGRSRNDLVVTDLRLWLLDAGRRIDGLIRMLARGLIERARENLDTVMPGTTHGRPAQPVTLAHHLLAHAWALVRDTERLRSWAGRADVSSLGAGALATSTLPIDPAVTAAELGMRRAFDNSIDAVSDRDFLLEFLAAAGIAAVHLSRLAADLARWSDPAIGWAELDEAYTTGSSMMPQKRNPDSVELVRGKTARIAQAFGRVSAVIAGLPLGYHRDLQEDKEPAFDAADSLEGCCAVMIGVVETVRFDPDRMREAAGDPGLFATDLAEVLVMKSVPFREAHRRIGALMLELDEAGETLADVGEERWQELGLPGGGSMLDPVRSVEARSNEGGPSASSVLRQIEAIEDALGQG